MNLKEFLLENLLNESKSEPIDLLKTADEAIEYFFEGKKTFTEEEKKQISAIKFLYSLAEKRAQKSNGVDDETIPFPFIKNYHNTKKNQFFAVRRWIETDTDWMNYCNKNDINPDKFFEKIGNKTPNLKKGIYHNTSLQKLDKFPNSSDFEILIAMSTNIKSFKIIDEKQSPEYALKYALFGDGDKKTMSDAEKKNYDKFLNWYKHNTEYVEGLSKNIEVNSTKGDPELFCKLHTQDVDVSDTWKKNKNSKRDPNKTPRADLISNKNRRISIKNGDTGAQAMSAGKDETMATLLEFKDLLNEEDQKKLDSLFEYDWKGKDSERNAKLDKIIKQIFDKNRNPEFVMAVIAESITGSNKFGGKNGSAKTILTFSNGECFEEDAETYVYRVFKDFDIKQITINHKSSHSTWVAMRILLPKHKRPYKTQLTEEEKNSKEFKILKNIVDKMKNTTEDFSKYTDDDIDKIQDELSNLDQKKDKKEIENKKELLKNIAKSRGENEEKFIPTIETGEDGKQYKKKVGPRGGEYYKVKGDDGWSKNWNSGNPPHKSKK